MNASEWKEFKQEVLEFHCEHGAAKIVEAMYWNYRNVGLLSCESAHCKIIRDCLFELDKVPPGSDPMLEMSVECPGEWESVKKY